jgi:flagellar hook-basal body complex protein FliE
VSRKEGEFNSFSCTVIPLLADIVQFLRGSRYNGGEKMNVSGIDSMLAQMRSAMTVAQGGVAPLTPRTTTGTTGTSGATDFAAVLKSSLDSVAQAQNHADSMQQAFVLGDDKVSLSNVMIDMQKANIAFQTTVQVRNKVIAAYNDIMNMQV